MRMGAPRVSNLDPIHSDRKPKELDLLSEVPPFPVGDPLGHDGELHWNQICKSLIAAKVLATPFLMMVERTCRVYNALRLKEKQMRQILQRDPNGNFIKTGTSIKEHPLVKAIQNETKIHAQLLNSLGLSPAARRAANIPIQGDSEDTEIPGARRLSDDDDDLAA